jgi:biopolymer transport protein ExbD
MQMSARARRMERRNERGSRPVMLNLVSLMDIFTILVFFLLVNSSEVEVLPNARDIQLPESVAEEKARENVVVMVTSDQILLQGRPVATVADVLARDTLVIPALEAALRQQTDRVLRTQARTDASSREVTIMGDRELPYLLLKRVMATCTAAEYGRISLAVMQRAPVRQAAARAAAPRG